MATSSSSEVTLLTTRSHVVGILHPSTSITDTLVGVSYIAGADSFSDPLTNPTQCQTDAALMKTAGVNTVYVYTVLSDKDHDGCMKTFADQGIYVWLQLGGMDGVRQGPCPVVRCARIMLIALADSTPTVLDPARLRPMDSRHGRVRAVRQRPGFWHRPGEHLRQRCAHMPTIPFPRIRTSLT